VKTGKEYILTFHLGAYFHCIGKNKNISIKIYDHVQHKSTELTFVYLQETLLFIADNEYVT
jgi:hypothetical protein